MNWSETLIDYYRNLRCPNLPAEVDCMNPYLEADVMEVVSTYFKRFYDDSNPRTLLFGINPGRFGAGITGISFTDPIILKDKLGIDHSFDLRPELSSGFIHEMIDIYGGIEQFTSRFFITSVYPLGFLKAGKNLNYYEIADWENSIKPEIIRELKTHREWNINREVGICIGKGQNLKYLTQLNKELGLFKRIITMPHPRWVMQYNLKKKDFYIDQFLKTLDSTQV